jgi:hypothetical protein
MVKVLLLISYKFGGKSKLIEINAREISVTGYGFSWHRWLCHSLVRSVQ